MAFMIRVVGAWPGWGGGVAGVGWGWGGGGVEGADCLATIAVWYKVG